MVHCYCVMSQAPHPNNRMLVLMAGFQHRLHQAHLGTAQTNRHKNKKHRHLENGTHATVGYGMSLTCKEVELFSVNRED